MRCGRTSLLKRFLSMPRYFGASRSRMKRGRNSVCEGCREGINDPAEVCGSGRLGTSCHSIPIMGSARKNVSPTNRGKFRRNSRGADRDMLLCGVHAPISWTKPAKLKHASGENLGLTAGIGGAKRVSPKGSAKLSSERQQFPTVSACANLTASSLRPSVLEASALPVHGIKGSAVMKTASDRFSKAEEGSVVADLFRAILLFIWDVVRIPILIVLAFLEPLIRVILVGIAILSLLTGLVYQGSSAPPPIPFWVMLSVSLGCVMLVPAYHVVLRFLSR